jgi:hypothetical protein
MVLSKITSGLSSFLLIPDAIAISKANTIAIPAAKLAVKMLRCPP